jgi:hypothetical protein
VAPEAKARACCQGLDVDCHVMADQPSGLGQTCRRHVDCEPGLLCAEVPEIPVNFCVCPGPAPTVTQCDRYRTGVLP